MTLQVYNCPTCGVSVYTSNRGLKTTCSCLTPVARATDPATSHLAAAEMAGKRPSLVAQVIQLVKENPGKTAGWYGDYSDIPGCWKRLSDAKFLEKIYADGTADYKGKQQQRLWPTLEQGQLFGEEK